MNPVHEALRIQRVRPHRPLPSAPGPFVNTPRLLTMPIVNALPLRLIPLAAAAAAAAALLCTSPAHADTGKLLLTGGVSSVECALDRPPPSE